MAEADIKRAFGKKLRKWGFEYFRMDTDGWPDWIVMGPNETVAFIEFKYGKGRLRKKQEERLAWLHANGFSAFVINSASDEVVNEFVEIMREKMEEKLEDSD